MDAIRRSSLRALFPNDLEVGNSVVRYVAFAVSNEHRKLYSLFFYDELRHRY